MGTPLRVLIVKDSGGDTLLLVEELRRGGYEPTFGRVDTPAAMTAALSQQPWDVVIADHAMPHFSAPAALTLLQNSGLDLPFIIVSGHIGEDMAVAAMKSGAHDYIIKDDLARLNPTIEREMREAQGRRERKRAEKQVEHHHQRQAVLRDINLAVTSTPDIRAVLEILADKIATLLPYFAVMVWLVNRESGALERASCRNLDEKEWKGSILENAPPLPQAVLEQKAPVTVRNVQKDARTRDPEFFCKHGLVSFLGAPMIAKGEVLGVLSFFTREEYEFSNEELGFLTTLAGQAAIAIHNSQLYEQVERRTHQLSALYAVTAAANKSLDLDAVLQEVIRKITEIFHFDATRIFLFNPRMDELHLQASFETLPELFARVRLFRRGEGNIGKVAQTGEPLIFEDIHSDPRYEEQSHTKTAEKGGFSFFAAFPIKSKLRTVGTIVCIGKDPRRLKPGEIQLITSMVDQVGVAVENAALYQESRRREEIQGFLKELSQDITSLDIDSLLKKLTEKVRELIKVDVADVRVIEEGKTRVKYMAGIDRDSVPPTQTETLRGGLAWIVKNRKALTIADITRDQGIAREIIKIKRLGIRGYLAVPLSSKDGEVVGAMRALSYQPREFTQEEIGLLQQMANGAAIAIENAQLYEQTRNQAAQLEKDITERKRAEGEIRRLNAELEQRVVQLAATNKELEAFSYSVSHDLRAPLRSINGFSQALLEDYANKLDAEGKDYLMHVRSASQYMAQLIDDMLNLSRLTRSEMSRETVDLTALVEAIAQELQKTNPGRQVRFVIAEGVVAEGDKRLLRVMLENLLGNAWKFTGKHPRARIEFGVTQHDDKTAYFLRDDGVGFDMAHTDQLFGAFQRLHTVNEFEGTGIGLATAQRIIHRHGGHVWAESAVEKGATFYFTL